MRFMLRLFICTFLLRCKVILNNVNTQIFGCNIIKYHKMFSIDFQQVTNITCNVCPNGCKCTIFGHQFVSFIHFSLLILQYDTLEKNIRSTVHVRDSGVPVVVWMPPCLSGL